MKWNKKIKAKMWAEMIANHIKQREEEKLIRRWNFLALEIGSLLMLLILLAKGVSI